MDPDSMDRLDRDNVPGTVPAELNSLRGQHSPLHARNLLAQLDADHSDVNHPSKRALKASNRRATQREITYRAEPLLLLQPANYVIAGKGQ